MVSPVEAFNRSENSGTLFSGVARPVLYPSNVPTPETCLAPGSTWDRECEPPKFQMVFGGILISLLSNIVKPTPWYGGLDGSGVAGLCLSNVQKEAFARFLSFELGHHFFAEHL